MIAGLMVSARVEHWPIDGAFTIARGAKTEAVVIVVEMTDGQITGRAECVPYARYGETPESVLAQIAAPTLPIAKGCGNRAARRRRAQCLGLRDVGLRSQEQRYDRGRDGRSRTDAAAAHRLYTQSGQPRSDGRQGGRCERFSALEAEARRGGRR